MPKLNQLQEAFKYISQTFFPRWKNGRHWRIRRLKKVDGLRRTIQGFCDNERKEILIRHIPAIQESLYYIIIHEICHAVTGCPGHRKYFQQRMLKVSQKAYKMGDRMLGNIIVHEVKRIKEILPFHEGWKYFAKIERR